MEATKTDELDRVIENEMKDPQFAAAFTAAEERDAVTEVTEASAESFAPAYRYRDAKLSVIWQTSVPKDDEAALAYFHFVVRNCGGVVPKYCEAITRDDEGEHYRMLPEMYDPETYSTRPYSVYL